MASNRTNLEFHPGLGLPPAYLGKKADEDTPQDNQSPRAPQNINLALLRRFTFSTDDFTTDGPYFNDKTLEIQYTPGQALRAMGSSAAKKEPIHIVPKKLLLYDHSQSGFEKFMEFCEIHVSHLAMKKKIKGAKELGPETVLQDKIKSPFYAFVSPKWEYAFDRFRNNLPVIEISQARFPPTNTRELVFLLRTSEEEGVRYGLTPQNRKLVEEQAKRMLDTFCKRPDKILHIQEMVILAHAQHFDTANNFAFTTMLLNSLLEELTRVVQDGDRVLQALCVVLQEAPEGALDAGNLVAILDKIREHILALEKRKVDPFRLCRTLEVCGEILDALQREDIELSREEHHHALYKDLKRLASEDPYRFFASYANQALVRIKDDTSKLASTWRRIKAASSGVGHILSAIKNHRPAYLEKAYENFREMGHRNDAPHAWYDEMNYIKFLIREGCFAEFEHFAYTGLKHAKRPILALGVSSLLCDTCKRHPNIDVRKEIVRYLVQNFLDHTTWGSDEGFSKVLPWEYRHPAQRLILKTLVGFVQDSDRSFSLFIKNHLQKLQERLQKGSFQKKLFQEICPDPDKLQAAAKPTSFGKDSSSLFAISSKDTPQLAIFQKMTSLKEAVLRNRRLAANLSIPIPVSVNGHSLNLDEALENFAKTDAPNFEVFDDTQMNRSDYCISLERKLKMSWKPDKPYPLFIPSSAIESDQTLNRVIREALMARGFTGEEANHLKTYPLFIISERYVSIPPRKYESWNVRFIFLSHSQRLAEKPTNPEVVNSALKDSVQAHVQLPKSPAEEALIKKRLENPKMKFNLEDSLSVLTRCVHYGHIQAQKARNQDVVIYVGNTGSGKSTLINQLMGCSMQLSGARQLVVVRPESEGGALNEVMPIGHAQKSKTFMPQIEFDPQTKITHCDCPGFLDNRGPEINIANAVNILSSLRQARSVKVVALVSYYSLRAMRARGLEQMLEICYNLFGQDLAKYKKSILIGITQVPVHSSLKDHKDLVLEGGFEVMEELKDQIFISDPLERPLKGGLTRKALLKKIKQLTPIRNPGRVFKTVLTPEDDRKLVEISEQIEQKISEHLRLNNFKSAISYLNRLEQLRVIDHPSVERVISDKRRLIAQQLHKCVNQFEDHCHFERFHEAEKVLDMLKGVTNLLEGALQNEIDITALDRSLRSHIRKHETLAAERREWEEQLKQSNQRVSRVLELLREQKESMEAQLEEQKEEFRRIIQKMETGLHDRLSLFDERRVLLQKELETRFTRRQKELEAIHGRNAKEIKEEREKFNQEYKAKIDQLEEERNAFVKEHKAEKQQREKALEEKEERIQEELQKIEASKQTQLQEKKRLEAEERRLEERQRRQREEDRQLEKKRVSLRSEPPSAASSSSISSSLYFPWWDLDKTCEVCNEDIKECCVSVTTKVGSKSELKGLGCTHLKCLGAYLRQWDEKEGPLSLKNIAVLTINKNTSDAFKTVSQHIPTGRHPLTSWGWTLINAANGVTTNDALDICNLCAEGFRGEKSVLEVEDPQKSPVFYHVKCIDQIFKEMEKDLIARDKTWTSLFYSNTLSVTFSRSSGAYYAFTSSVRKKEYKALAIFAAIFVGLMLAYGLRPKKNDFL